MPPFARRSHGVGDRFRRLLDRHVLLCGQPPYVDEVGPAEGLVALWRAPVVTQG
jgi:hypothetical protein